MVADEIARDLPRVQRRIYEAIRDAGSAGIAWREVMWKVYGDDWAGGPTSNTVSVLINQHLKPTLKRYGLTISSRGGPGSLYRLARIEP